MLKSINLKSGLPVFKTFSFEKVKYYGILINT